MSVVSRNTLCTAIALHVISLPPAFAAELRDIRTGFHHTYSRVVIETSVSTPYALSLDKTDSTLTITAGAVARVARFGPVKIDPRDPLLRRLRFWRTSRGLTVAVELKVSHVRTEHRLLSTPYRIVVDIYPAGPTPASPDSGTSTRDNVSAGLPARPPQKTAVDQPDQGAMQDSSEEDALSGEPPLQAGQETPTGHLGRVSRVTIFWLLTGAFLLICAFVLFLAIRRRRAEKVHGVNIRNRTQGAPPSKRPEMPSPEFLDFLKSAVENQSPAAAPIKAQRDARPMGKTAKLDALIGSLAAVVKTSAADTAESLPPAFKEIAHDLNMVTGQGEISEEEARRQLIGRDGVEFMRNIKRLYLSQ